MSFVVTAQQKPLCRTLHRIFDPYDYLNTAVRDPTGLLQLRHHSMLRGRISSRTEDRDSVLPSVVSSRIQIFCFYPGIDK